MKTFCLWLVLTAFMSASAMAAKAPDHFSFVFKTTQGDIRFECPKGWAPLGEQRLYELIKAGFFKDIAFFRVITGFMAQFGISGDPKVSAQWADAKLIDDPVVGSNVAGTLTYADSGPNTRTTQLFINLADNPRLDGSGFSPVCKLAKAEDLAVVKKLYAGYGEGAPSGSGPNQDSITHQGNSYLKMNFPKLDYIKAAVIK